MLNWILVFLVHINIKSRFAFLGSPKKHGQKPVKVHSNLLTAFVHSVISLETGVWFQIAFPWQYANAVMFIMWVIIFKDKHMPK